MATRSTIALEYADGTVQQVYCHWDGYLEYNGRLLYEHYQDSAKTELLIAQGDISSLSKEIGVKHPFDAREGGITQAEYDSLYSDMTTFYGRDRSERNVKAKKFSSFDNYCEKVQFEEYNYILRTDGKWYVAYDGSFVLLADELADALRDSHYEEQDDA